MNARDIARQAAAMEAVKRARRAARMRDQDGSPNWTDTTPASPPVEGAMSEEQRTETPNDRFERLAAEFYEDTGKMAPGKDVPAAFGVDDYDLRSRLWNAWLARRKRAASRSSVGASADTERLRDLLADALRFADGIANAEAYYGGQNDDAIILGDRIRAALSQEARP